MRFVLVIPPSPWLISDRDFPFLGPLYIASAAADICHTTVCDLSGIPEEYWHIPVADVYGITGTSPNYPYIKKIVDKFKKRDPYCMVVVGGVHASLMPEQILSETETDYIFVGEGENGIRDFLAGIPANMIAGFGSRTFRNPPALVADIDKFMPDREAIDYFDYLVPGTHKYLAREQKREGTIITSRGCPYSCSFCASRKLNHGKVRYRDVGSIVEELRYLRSRFKTEFVYILDDTFALTEKRVFEVCNAIAPLNIKWYCLTRVDRASREMFKAMKDAGCLSVTYGIESGSDWMLQRMKKNTTSDQGYHAVALAKDAGLKVRGQIIVGFPGENEDTVKATAKFMKNAAVDAWGVHVFQAYPGTDVWCNPNHYGILLRKDEDFSMHHTIGKPDGKLTNDKQVQKWFNYLRKVAGQENVHKK